MTINFCVRRFVLILAAAILSACGGGGGGGGMPSEAFIEKPLPVGENVPAAYTADHLDAHPDELIQPEHLLIVNLDPSKPNGTTKSIRLHIRESMSLAIDTSNAAKIISELTIYDNSGQVVVSHHPTDDALAFSLQPGTYRLVFKASPQLAAAQTIFLKFADTPAQARIRQDATYQATTSSGNAGLGAKPAPTSLGVVSATCYGCSFDRADLENQDLSGANLWGSTFRETIFQKTNMANVICIYCIIQPAGIPTDSSFKNTNLWNSSLTGTFFGVDFSGSNISNSTLVGRFDLANLTSATFQTSDLTQATLWNAKLQYADFSGAAALNLTTFFQYGIGGYGSQALLGTQFNNVTPSNLFVSNSFAGMDLTGASFAGMDMSGADLSTASGTKITPANFGSAILTNGLSGANLSGQDFGQFTGWAGSSDGTRPGRDLRGVNLSNANLFEADLTGVNLSNATLIGADLTNSSLKNAKLIGAQIGVAPGSGSLTAANLSGAYMPQADFTDADLRSAKFDNAHAYGNVKFLRARLDSASMIGTNLANADFTNASLSNTNFTQAYLINTIFSGATLQNASMYKSYLQGAAFLNTVSVAGLSMIDAYVSTQSGNWSFTEADGAPFIYAYGETVLGDLATVIKGVATCPNGQLGPCSGNKLLPTPAVPYPPPPPACIPVAPTWSNCLPPVGVAGSNKSSGFAS